LRLTLFALGVIVILFFIHHHLHLYPAFAAFAGLALALALLRPEPNVLIGGVNWSVLIFFSGLFIIVGGVESSGLLDLLGEELGSLAKEPEMLLVTCLVLMWMSAILSAIVDNIPFTVTMIPIILGLESQGVNIVPLWWALALGVGLGGNATHIGATANLIAVAESEQCGIPNARISPAIWMRHGVPTTLVSLTLATLLFTAFFDYFR
jgi:Na+/H+ antiporter NhaD/arsenite permease-like protein